MGIRDGVKDWEKGIRNDREVMMAVIFFFKQKTADEVRLSLVGSEMCLRDRGAHRKQGHM